GEEHHAGDGQGQSDDPAQPADLLRPSHGIMSSTFRAERGPRSRSLHATSTWRSLAARRAHSPRTSALLTRQASSRSGTGATPLPGPSGTGIVPSFDRMNGWVMSCEK